MRSTMWAFQNYPDFFFSISRKCSRLLEIFLRLVLLNSNNRPLVRDSNQKITFYRNVCLVMRFTAVKETLTKTCRNCGTLYYFCVGIPVSTRFVTFMQRIPQRKSYEV